MKSIRSGLVALFAAAVGFNAQAEVLVYDGFPINGTGVTGAYSATNRSKLVDANVTNSGIIGFKDTKWQNNTSVIYSFTSGLSLPAGFDELPSAAYVGAGSAGANADGANDERGVWKTLTDQTVSAIKEAKELHYRVLLSADEKALSTLTVSGSDNSVPDKSALSAGFYLSSVNHYGSARNSNGKTTRAVSFAIRRVNTTTCKVSLLVMGTEDALTTSGAIRTYDLATYTAGSTMICYAKITKDAGADQKEKIEAWVQDVTAYNPKQDFQTSVEAQLIDNTGTGALNAFDFACGSYTTKNGFFMVDEIALATKGEDILVLGLAGAPKVASARLERTASGYQVAGTVTKSSADVVGVILTAPTSTETTIPGAGVTVEGDVAADFTRSFTTEELSADTTYAVTAYAANTVDTDRREAGTFYTGALTLTKVQDAAEKDAVVGQVTVSRASADPYPLTVNYTLTSACEAAAEGRTWVAPTPVVIPANETSATLTLTPKNDMSVDEDISVTLALADGNYEIAAEPIVLTLVNNSVPSDANVWVAGADGFASVAENWSYGHAPRTDESVLFDGDYSTAACTWDADAAGGPSATIASLKVASTYTKTITILTTFPEVAGSSFHTLTVTGDALLNGGTLTHAKHTSDHRRDYYRLALSVGGNLTVGSAAKISADEKGSYLAVSGLASTYGGSYSGGGRAWGSLTEPTNVGSSGHAQNAVALAGGALWLEVAGAATVDGNISANGVKGSSGDAYAGSGGSVYLKAATLSGTGSVSANCQMTERSSTTKSGAGGRVSILLTEGELTDFPMANVTAYAANASYANVGGAGTILVRTPQKPNGILYLKDRTDKFGTYGYRPSVAQLTDMPQDATWTLDGIVFGPNAILRVRTDNVLELVNGLESVSNPTSTERENGIFLDNGATLRLPSSATHTISTPWLFQANGGFTLNGNLVLANGGSVGTHNLYITNTNSTPRCEMRVTGDMTVAEGSYIWAQGGGYFGNAIDTVPFGKNIRGSHGGQNAADSSCVCYDSFFNPRMPGGFGDNGNYFPVGGGAVILTVDGELALNGRATASPKTSGVKGRPGAAGTINLTVGALTGTGSIDANGQKWDNQYDQGNFKGASGGGRVAVKLTRKGAAFDEHWLSHITAKGASPTYVSTGSGVTLKTEYASSAGSVYLQNAAQGEGAGLISVFNDGDSSNTKAYTALPARAFGGEDDVFSKASLSIGSCAQVRLMETLKMQDLTLAANTALDLNGKKLTVAKAVLGPTKLNSGTYTAAQIAKVAGEGYVSGEGTLEVTGGGIAVIIR